MHFSCIDIEFCEMIDVMHDDCVVYSSRLHKSQLCIQSVPCLSVISLIRFRSHPHELMGQNCARGVCYIPDIITNSEAPSVIYFPRLKIQCAKKNEIEAKLKERQILRIDPFGSNTFIS